MAAATSSAGEEKKMEHKIVLAVAAFIAGLAGVFFTSYMVGGHTEHAVELLIAQFIGNGLLAAILATLILR